MIRRPLLWLSAFGAALGVAVAVPTPAAAQDAGGWRITVESEEVSDDHIIGVAGEAALLGNLVLRADTVTVTVERGADLPDACTVPEPQTVGVVGGRYAVDLPVTCNGPYRVSAVATGTGGVRSPAHHVDVGVAAKPAAPSDRPESTPIEGGSRISWPASPHPDAVGWRLVTADGERHLPIDQLSTVLGPEMRQSTIALRVVHWGAAGPKGTDVVVSDPSGFTTVVIGRESSDSTELPSSPSSAPPGPRPAPDLSGRATVPSGTNPPTTSGPSRGTGSSQPLPEGYSEELPFGTRPEAFAPGSTAPAAEPTGDREAAVGAPAPAGFVRTTEKSKPGLVAPFALAVMMLTVAAHIAWFLRRSRPAGTGQVGPR